MRQKREFNLLRPYLLSILFLCYYGGIAVICWALFSLLNSLDINTLFESKVLLTFIFIGFASGGLLFFTALDKFELTIRWYWNQRSGKGVLKAFLYLAIQFLLFCLPFELVRHGYWFMQQLTPLGFILILGVTLTGITYLRFKGITHEGLSLCAQ